MLASSYLRPRVPELYEPGLEARPTLSRLLRLDCSDLTSSAAS